MTKKLVINLVASIPYDAESPDLDIVRRNIEFMIEKMHGLEMAALVYGIPGDEVEYNGINGPVLLMPRPVMGPFGVPIEPEGFKSAYEELNEVLGDSVEGRILRGGLRSVYAALAPVESGWQGE